MFDPVKYATESHEVQTEISSAFRVFLKDAAYGWASRNDIIAVLENGVTVQAGDKTYTLKITEGA